MSQISETAREERLFQNLLCSHSAFLNPVVKSGEWKVSLSPTVPKTEARTINSELSRQRYKPDLCFSYFYPNTLLQARPTDSWFVYCGPLSCCWPLRAWQSFQGPHNQVTVDISAAQRTTGGHCEGETALGQIGTLRGWGPGGRTAGGENVYLYLSALH